MSHQSPVGEGSDVFDNLPRKYIAIWYSCVVFPLFCFLVVSLYLYLFFQWVTPKWRYVSQYPHNTGIWLNIVCVILHDEQAGAEQGQAQIKLELGFTSFKICCIKLYIRFKTNSYRLNWPSRSALCNITSRDLLASLISAYSSN